MIFENKRKKDKKPLHETLKGKALLAMLAAGIAVTLFGAARNIFGNRDSGDPEDPKAVLDMKLKELVASLPEGTTVVPEFIEEYNSTGAQQIDYQIQMDSYLYDNAGAGMEKNTSREMLHQIAVIKAGLKTRLDSLRSQRRAGPVADSLQYIRLVRCTLPDGERVNYRQRLSADLEKYECTETWRSSRDGEKPAERLWKSVVDEFSEMEEKDKNNNN